MKRRVKYLLPLLALCLVSTSAWAVTPGNWATEEPSVFSLQDTDAGGIMLPVGALKDPFILARGGCGNGGGNGGGNGAGNGGGNGGDNGPGAQAQGRHQHQHQHQYQHQHQHQPYNQESQEQHKHHQHQHQFQYGYGQTP